ncbi:DUF4893 domain-containing protein [Luteimonas sp. S4-F44]|uniref:DUF4893 domain-containing protein n=1 Tax=Luteimonas sp. S4-F44 TaxID=2925842 RepID=UPI001F52D6D0|nr:DUF4893 domain-containing protein [Luteimonas sp. S4-F44]UNK41732.1 DUF4893 domain-containing protein [Luteimonas sp. S4-F44]
MSCRSLPARLRAGTGLAIALVVVACSPADPAPTSASPAAVPAAADAATVAANPVTEAAPPTQADAHDGTPDDWRAQVWPTDRDAILAEPTFDLALDDHDPVLADARQVLALAGSGRPLGTITGAWQVRSLQFDGRGGAYAYPWFDATIARQGGVLTFAKTSGSQRRQGRLLPIDRSTLAFLGSQSVNDEPSPGYSRQWPSPPAARVEGDSVGRLVRTGESELLMVLDVDGPRFELYQLRR